MIKLLLASVMSFSSWAVETPVPSQNSDQHQCESYLINKVKLIPSGREGKVFDDFVQIAKKYVEPGGIFERLGVSIPPQTLHFMPGGDVNTVGAINGYPVAHWTDGQKVVRNPGSGLLYEIVIPGKDEDFGFYRDDNSLDEQTSIFLHATAGHNHFTENSRFPHFRTSNRIQEAIELSDYMDQVRAEGDFGEVSDWYQYLLTLSGAQDYINAVYETPDDLKVMPPKRTAKGYTQEGFKETRNILQAFVANLPSDTPEWKIEIAKRFERMHRFGPGMARTKIVNEGYSTLMQILLPKHAGLTGFKETVHYCCLLHGVASKDISNPYWLGLEAWKNVYARFLKRPEIAELKTWEEKDGAFIRYATREIIAVMDDEMFLNFALDDAWVVKQNLAMTRPYTEEEYNASGLQPEDPRDPKKNWPFAIVTRNPRTIIRSLINQEKGFYYKFPSPYVTNWNDNGVVALELKDPVGRRIGLDARSAVETLYVMAQIKSGPVSLEATFDSEDTPEKEEDENSEFEAWWWHRPPPKPTWTKTRYRITVFPDGKVEVDQVFRNGSSSPESLPDNDLVYDRKKHTPEYKPEPELGKLLEEVVQRYLYNLTLGQPIQEELFKPKSQLKIQEAVVDSVLSGGSISLQMNVPTAPRALLEYKNFLSSRISAALNDAIMGKTRVIRRPNGVQVSALPNIPYFRFDRQSLQREIENTPNLPLPRTMLRKDTLAMGSIFRPGDFTDIKPVDGREGDVGWGPKPGGGQGEGEGEEPGGDGPSEEGGDLQTETVMLDDYADALAEHVTLPNLRPKVGLDIRKDDAISGRRNSVTGMPMNRQILRNAFRRGFPTPDEMKDGVSSMDGSDIIRRGLSRLQKQNDWVVRDFEPAKAPDLNAVVFFQMDMSGSMERFKKTAKQILFDLRAVLKRKYKNITFVYIAFNDKTYVFDNPEEFFAFRPNGGTRYAHSFKKTIELYEKFPSATWDRFPVIVGDLDEASEAEEHNSFREMKEGAQFTAIFRTHSQPFWDDLANFFKAEAASDDYVGYLDIIPETSYAPHMLGIAFKNEKAE